MTRRRATVLVLGLLTVLVGVTLGLAGRAALRAADLAGEAQTLLVSAQSASPAEGDDASGALVRSTRAADVLLRSADRALRAPAPRVVAAVPVLGRSLRVERAVVRAARSAVSGVGTVAAAGNGLRTTGGRLDVGKLSALSASLGPAADRASADLDALRAEPLGLTPPVVVRKARQAEAGLQPVVDALRAGQTGARLGATLLRGPRRVMVALENNAELRGTGGYTSSLAFGDLRGGALTLGAFQQIETVSDRPGRARRVPATAEYHQDYGPFLADTTLLQNWTMSPDVPSSAAVGARAVGALTGRTPDVVLLLDVPALARLVTLTGQPVVLDGRAVTGDALLKALLIDAYARAGSDTAAQLRRRSTLQAAASRAVAGLLGAGLSPVRLAPAAAELARGRHLALWSRIPSEQAQLRRLGLTGDVGVGCEDLATVSTNNLNANKLDYYVQRTVDVDVRVARRSARVVQKVRLVNTAPADAVPYVAGTGTPGTARERVELSLGPRARDVVVTVNGRALPSSVRASPGRTRVATYVQLRRGRPVDVEVRYLLPRDGEAYRLHLVPQPLARDASLHLRVRGTAQWRLAREVRVDAPFTDERLVEVAPPVETRVQRLRRWFREPIRLPV
ncbi:MAG: hypothetical protein JWN17_2939 [Frankiales bacterium]|nr:hypothetical protein [Frankiales bacterium]